MSHIGDHDLDSTMAARATGRAVVGRRLARYQRAKVARQAVRQEAAWRARYQVQQNARRRLTERYGSDLEKRWIANPNGPRVDAVSLLYAFMHKAGPLNLQSPQMKQTPPLERDDALAAAHLIHAAREDARLRDITMMKHVLAHGVTWDELAHALETTADDLKKLLRWWI